MKIPWVLTIGFLICVTAHGQALDLKNLDKLSDKAKDVTDISLDGSLLKFAAKFLSNDDPDQAKVKKLVAELKGIYVRTYDFEKEGDYIAAVTPTRLPSYSAMSFPRFNPRAPQGYRPRAGSDALRRRV